jgi:hypothetical protein
MSKTIYWAIKLDSASKSLLLSKFPAKHPNVYAEHMTIIFRPSDKVDSEMMNKCGLAVSIRVVGHAYDNNGQAVKVESDAVSKIGGGIPHITISCASGTKPVYSNKLLAEGDNQVPTLVLTGIVARFTDKGWDTKSKE